MLVEGVKRRADVRVVISVPRHHDKHRFIDRDWKGLKSPVDAVMTGRMYVPSWRSTRRRSDYRFDQQYQQYGQQWGRRRQSRSPFWGSIAERGMNMGQEMAERGMEMGLRLAERRMELEDRLGRDWDRMWDQDWDQDRRRDGYQWNNRGNYDSRRDRMYWDTRRGYEPIQTVYFFKGGNPLPSMESGSGFCSTRAPWLFLILCQ